MRYGSSLRLFLLSILILFLEMMLIRWIGTEIRIFAYVQNVVLVVCFLGLGVGCARSSQKGRLWQLCLPLLILIILVNVPVTRNVLQLISSDLSTFDDTIIWYKAVVNSEVSTFVPMLQGVFLAFAVLLLIFDAFEILGRHLGAEMATSSGRISRYSVNIAGSLAGIWLFTAMSYCSSPPAIWAIALAILILLSFVDEVLAEGRLLLLIAALPIPFVIYTEMGTTTTWSPYQKLSMSPYVESPNSAQMLVNNVGYQLMLDLSEENVLGHPDVFSPSLRTLSHYDIPFRFSPNPKKVLLLGAGSGNDAAGALRNGAERITAVEIDPVIIDLGMRSHPEHPYASERVTVVNDDARTFLQKTNETFDVIIFGLLDAHTGNALTNVRLDHYIYTREALLQAKSRLTPDGKLFLSFGMGFPFIAARIDQLLRDAFGVPPLSFISGTTPAYGWGGTMFVAAREGEVQRALALDPALAAWIAPRKIAHTTATIVPTDDWPYLYLSAARIPSLYYVLGAVIVGVSAFRGRGLWRQGLAQWGMFEGHLFLLGFAFLLLEVQNINKAALVFGNTWTVNAIVVSGIMIMSLLSNAVAALFPRISSTIICSGLVLSLVLLIALPVSFFGLLGVPLRQLLYGIVVSLPVFFSGILFIRAFNTSRNPAQALAANLLGALFGGLLQSLSFVTGMQTLFLLTIVVYLGAIITRPKGEEALH